ncbi:MAG: polysaccharide deacetylase family protein [Desulfobacula sp.]|uniref:polysaccharide deacetylase family protein n=1 Tax=Desulfobacula sp. TaxID=2593537 RepID=UPI0025C116A9|nr:polysaccharide deacetylase family protein [Desulfobacula sp.]MCD4721610.1 polysaccharide deacetylase family protein [Desulfobacula sp.]
MGNGKVALILTCLIFVIFFTSCVAKNSPVQHGSLIYKSNDYALCKLEKEGSFAQLATIHLGDKKWVWKIEDANNINTLREDSFVAIPLKEKNMGGLFENGYQSVPILCYHKFGTDRSSPLTIPSHVFNQQMKYLKDNGYRVISPKNLLDFLEYRGQIPKKSVLITMDDGYRSVYDVAWPILKKYEFTATIFVYTNYVGISKKAMSWEDLRTLKAHGFTIGSHTVSHRDLTQKQPDETADTFYNHIKEEVFLSKKIIDRELSQDTICLSFPYGRYSPDLLKIAESVGYRMAVTVERGSNPFFSNPLALKRDMILKKDMKSFISRLKTFNNLSLK